jgi:hypothetical protein
MEYMRTASAVTVEHGGGGDLLLEVFLNRH